MNLKNIVRALAVISVISFIYVWGAPSALALVSNDDVVYDTGVVTLLKAAENNRADIVSLTLASGVGVAVKDEKGYTALHFAAKGDAIDAAKELIDSGARIDAVSGGPDFFTPLHIAARSNSNGVAKLLIEKGADVNARSGYLGYVPIHLAAMKNALECVELLLEKGVDIESKASGNVTPLLVFVALATDRDDVGRFLVEKGANVNARGASGWTALLYCVGRNDKLARYLIEKGADVRAKLDDGTTALHIAARMGDKAMIKIVLDKGADVNARLDQSGRTPLDVAEKPETVKFLKDAGGRSGIDTKKPLWERERNPERRRER